MHTLTYCELTIDKVKYSLAYPGWNCRHKLAKATTFNISVVWLTLHLIG